MSEPLDTRIVVTCAFCGHEFLAKNKNRKTCSDKCRKRLSRWRSRLSALHGEVMSRLDEIGIYLNYDGARRPACNSLSIIRKHCLKVMADHGVKAV